MGIYSRVVPQSLPAKLLKVFEENDEHLAWRCASKTPSVQTWLIRKGVPMKNWRLGLDETAKNEYDKESPMIQKRDAPVSQLERAPLS